MVGMNQMKKKLFTGIIIGASVSVVGIGLTLWWAISTIKSYEAGTNKKYNRLYTRDVLVLNREVTQGEPITADMVTTINVHKNAIPSDIISLSDISSSSKKADEGKIIVAKYNIPASMPLTKTMVTEEIVDADLREQEINTIIMPSDLVASDYVDIRIMYPNGTDYIVLTQKKVGEISGSTMWLTLTEDERLRLNGAIVDAFLNEGSKLYATKYVDTDAQVRVAKEDDKKLRGYMIEAISKTFNLEVSQTEIDSMLEDENNSTNVSENLDTANKIYNLIVKYRNFATNLTKVTENYQPNEQIIAMMNSNANVLPEARNRLSTTARQNMESALRTYKTNQGDDYQNIIDGAQNSIEEQKSEREKLLGE